MTMMCIPPRAVLSIALVVALLPLTSFVSVPRTSPRTSVESGGAVDRPLKRRDSDSLPEREERRLRLSQGAQGTYIGEMLAERDSALARWPDRRGIPLDVWIQPSSSVEAWSESYVREVAAAFGEWDMLQLPVRFAFTSDSAHANVHVSFVRQFDEEISGRTTWARDDHWWITDADIVLAVYHHNGARLDDDAMHAMSLHEIGHLLGLDHTLDPMSIMASRVRVRALSDADRATVRLVYTLPPGGVR